MSEFFTAQTCPELKQLKAIEQSNLWIHKFSKFCAQHPAGRIYNSCSMIAGGAFSMYNLVKWVPMFIDWLKHDQSYQTIGISLGVTAYLSAITAGCLYMSYKDYKNAFEKRNKMHSLSELISIAGIIENICFNERLSLQQSLSKLIDAEGCTIINELKKGRYTSEQSYLFAAPLVHSFLYSMYQKEQYLAYIFSAIAEMDAYNVIATKIIESQNQQNKFCFVTFTDAENPSIKTNNFWHVLVNNAVSNDLYETKNIILTGPNAGGKTTAIKAILQNIVFAQTCGIAAADEFEITLFDIIHSYLNVSDDLINGLSLFASEVKRAQEILETLKTLQQDQKFFCALDELFTGTVSEDGEICAYQFVKRISGFDKAFFVYATHFNKLKELGVEDVANCINYKVDAPIKDDQGKLKYPFTLSHGASDVRVALDIAAHANLFA